MKYAKVFPSRCDGVDKDKSKSGIACTSNPFSHLHFRNIGVYTSTVPQSAAAISRKRGHICTNEQMPYSFAKQMLENLIYGSVAKRKFKNHWFLTAFLPTFSADGKSRPSEKMIR